MITSLLCRAYAHDVDLYVEAGKLKYRATAGSLTPEFKEQLIANKKALLVRIAENKFAQDGQWTVFNFGEAYEKRTGERSELMIFRNDDDTFTVWRGSWKADTSKPTSQTTIADKVKFEEAFNRANNYSIWSAGKRKRAG